jgi:PEP-CTERM motif
MLRTRFILAAALALATTTASAATLQVISGPTGQRAATLEGFGPVGQSFTAFDRVISSVGFQFEALNPTAANTPINLTLRSGSSLTGASLFSTSFTLPLSINSTAATWFDVAVPNWTVTTGQVYTLVLANTGSSFRNAVVLGPEINIQTGQVLGGDAYAGGTALFTTQPYQGFCLAQGICDLNFRVTATTPAVAAVPEPGTWALMLAGFGVVGFTLRRSNRRSITIA